MNTNKDTKPIPKVLQKRGYPIQLDRDSQNKRQPENNLKELFDEFHQIFGLGGQKNGTN